MKELIEDLFLYADRLALFDLGGSALSHDLLLILLLLLQLLQCGVKIAVLLIRNGSSLLSLLDSRLIFLLRLLHVSFSLLFDLV